MNDALSLDFDSIIAEAKSATALTNFGDTRFEQPLRVLLHALDTEAKLNEMGRMGQRARIVDILIGRLRAEEYIRRYPEILDEQIEAPVVIVGLPRTGTTMLHRTMACDDRFYAPLWYETRYPAPDLDWDFSLENDARINRAEQEVAAMLAASPDLAAIHPLEACGADEELMLLEQSFFSTTPEAFCYIPSYGQWLSEADNTPGYEYLKRQLQFLQWQKNRSGAGARAQRWLLKTPHHLHQMKTLLSVFPDAKIVQTHRDPVQTIPSICSFHHALWIMASDQVDDHLVAEQWSTKFAAGMRHTMDVRDDAPEVFLDLWFEQTTIDAEGCAKQIYDFVGMEATEQALEAMAQWRQDNRREDRAAHHYTLAQFGLTEEGLRQQFADYRRRFIEAEPSSNNKDQ
ncbi:hypothetical protein SIN8267_01505 [Sinobacterium norvegicum]|uniref:Sulfotransferase n=1 Tax=Sinobacterium norvegicum TaxID=1641715 RepID=A0ABN8EG39_9GAMM|nr:sulfotransferase [Sinobacterium norvegicum]CAH0991401.1 hypothetical protein SIN8267_01505 [Sinobacterium norvegicum]